MRAPPATGAEGPAAQGAQRGDDGGVQRSMTAAMMLVCTLDLFYTQESSGLGGGARARARARARVRGAVCCPFYRKGLSTILR